MHKAPKELESWKVLELKMAKCCCAGECQKCFVFTSELSQTALFFLIQPLGNPSAEQIRDAPGYPAAPKVKVRKLFAAPAFCSLTDVRRLLTCQFSENRRAKLIKNSDGALCNHLHRDTRCDLGTLPLVGHDGIRAGMRSGSAIKSGKRGGYLSGVL